MTIQHPERLDEAMKLLAEAAIHMADYGTAPNETWCKRFFLLEGSHMILTEDGWERGSLKPEMAKDAERHGLPLSEFILDEVNAP